MNERDILHLLEKGAGQKTAWLPPKARMAEIAEHLAAMANAEGGVLLIGVTPKARRPVGVENPDDMIDRVLQAALSTDPPLIIPMPEAIRIGRGTVIAVTIPHGMPHVYSLEGRFPARRGVENRPLKAKELRRLLIERDETGFESKPCPGATLDDIDRDRVADYMRHLPGSAGMTQEEVLLKRGCLARYGGDLLPTNAGILLFGKDTQRFLPGATITAARFAGTRMGDTFIRSEIAGTIPDQILQAETFLIDNLRREVSLTSRMSRAERFEYPLEAARELVVNAVAHRDYSIRGDGIRLFIFADRLEVTSPGRLPGPVTVENIADERFSRNTAIVQVLSDMGFIEKLGYGVDRVIALMRERGLPDPEFEETAGGFRAVLRKEPETGKLVGIAGIELNPRQEAAIRFLTQGGHSRITNRDLQEMFPDVHPETIRRDLAELVDRGILLRMGKKRGSYYVLKRL